jgi:anti-anti-sigma factor
VTNRCDVWFADDKAILEPAGDVDLEMTACLRDALAIALARGGVAVVAVNLGRATYLDTSAISVLLTAHRAAQRRNIRLTIARAGPVARLVMELTGAWATLSGTDRRRKRNRPSPQQDASPATLPGEP